MKRIRIYLSLLTVVVLLAGCLALPAAAANTSGYAAEVLRLVNAERAKAGLAALSGMSALNSAAQKRAQEIAGKFSHTRPGGGACFTVLGEYGVSYSKAGENIAFGQTSPADVVSAWMKSSGHKANILGDYDTLGVGVHEANGRIYWAQMFIRGGGSSSAGAADWRNWPVAAQWFAKMFLLGWLWMK